MERILIMEARQHRCASEWETSKTLSLQEVEEDVKCVKKRKNINKQVGSGGERYQDMKEHLQE